MRYRNRPLLAAALTAAYFGAAIGAVASFNLGLPPWLEQALSLLAAPAVLLLLVWNPVLRPLGLLHGEAVALPKGWVCVLLVLLYAGLVYLITLLLSRRKRP
ncbi:MULTISPECIES: hypothetical protein [unclassified Massilia]|uniref:hypothetical protein n=1 Tax=unclassified Massilia TaxID=2609279 RepID=UPI001B8326A6|nr:MULTISPECIES: hypothetical protein [unclassified Massilia]MBQ5938413.1 hypothetical protein [Massilia sp. AB1]MBQ5963279.1 hypothetical protein [Massilia sp. ZL223]